MKRLYIILLLAFYPLYNVNGQEIRHVITHQRVTVTTHPSGTKTYVGWGKFPPVTEEIRKVLMHVTLGCPDSLPCAHWDYLDPIRILRKGGVKGENLGYEIGRMLTPYGSIYNKGWEFTWQVDVTDFTPVLRDSVEIAYTHTGWEPSTVGWALTIDFELVPGKQVINPISILPLWNGSYRYGDPAKKISQQILPLSYSASDRTYLSRLRIQQTGHGMDKPRGCSEFCSRWRELFLDGLSVNRTNLWKECGSNPLYPQGGTWIFDRGWWCPGDLQPADVYDLLTKPGTHQLSLEMEPYQASDNIQAAENIAAYLIQYEQPNSKNDVTLEEILVPNRKPLYNRMNPANFHPKIIIRNAGSQPLKKLDINYQTIGGLMQQYHWTGYLNFNEKQEITLPGIIQSPGKMNQFVVKLSNPNGRKDEWTKDNQLTSSFEAPMELPEKFVLQYLTNNHPKENGITICNSKGDTIYYKNGAETLPRTFYCDTLTLTMGQYELMLNDTAGNGLEFWYEADQGYGYLRLVDLQGKLLKNFESDCGNGQFFAFKTTPTYKSDSCSTQYAFVLYPRITSDSIALDYHADLAGKMEVLITSDGKVVERHEYQQVKQGRFHYNVGYLPKGRYILEAIMNGESRFKRRFNKE